MPHELIDTISAARYCAITERHIRELVYRREIPFIKVGRLVRFNLPDLDAWLQARTTPARVK